MKNQEHYTCSVCQAKCMAEAMTGCERTYDTCPVIAGLNEGTLTDNGGHDFAVVTQPAERLAAVCDPN